MALSIGDTRINAAIESDAQEHDPPLRMRRPVLWNRQPEPDRALLLRLRRLAPAASVIAVCIVLLGAGDMRGPGPWLWAAVAATWALLAFAVARSQMRRSRSGN
jgi:hypothetical protein